MKEQNSHRILTTHVGSLPRPKDLLDLMKARLAGSAPDAQLYESKVRNAVIECVYRQAETGIDILNDGEQSKPGFFTYIREYRRRVLSGLRRGPSYGISGDH